MRFFTFPATCPAQRVKFRSRKDGEQSIVIPKSAVKLLDGDKDGSMRMYPTYLKGVIKHRALHLGGKASPPCDCLVMTATGSLFLCMPCAPGSAIARENQAGRPLCGVNRLGS